MPWRSCSPPTPAGASATAAYLAGGRPRRLPTSWRASAVAGRVRRTPGVLDLDHVPPAVGLGAVEVAEAVFPREAAGGERAAGAALDVRVGGEGGDRAADEVRALGDRGEVRVA